jgi:hypothetical protein
VKNLVVPPPENVTLKPLPSTSVEPPFTTIGELNATEQLSSKVMAPCAATAVASAVSVGHDVNDCPAGPAAPAEGGAVPHNQNAASAVDAATGATQRIESR